ncbi:MAG: 7-cyano-7-deazaguanine synthase QueC [Rhodospirillales bacterium]|nr:7-cyano-7-deazaguanine synthase QueC [Alphaproteobacteria bacterium]MBL6948035.1 7-cyano-7-deazaguanine synthase QueC [Rhodospirillales bacterium]
MASGDSGKRKAVVLLSGGLDSATCLAIAANEGFQAHALTFRYGQRHQAEIEAARTIAGIYAAAGHDFFDIDLAQFGGSALTGDVAVPKDRSEADIADGIPVTYVPARNTVFLSLALARAETLAATEIFIGVNALDYSGYPDCRPEYIKAFQTLANLATKTGVEAAGGEGEGITLHAPLQDMTKAEIIRKGTGLGVDYSRTMSCYDPVLAPGQGNDGFVHCGHCDACQLRRKGFAEAGIDDPTVYAG